MMNNDKFMELTEYQFGFNTVGEDDNRTVVVNIEYPKKWRIIETPEGIKSFNREGVTYYWIDGSTNIELILNLINETIELNKDLEKRYEMLIERVDELKKLFSEKDIEELKRLEFVIKPKRRRSTKSKASTTKPKEKAVESKTEPNNKTSVEKLEKKDDKKIEDKDSKVEDKSINEDTDKKILEAIEEKNKSTKKV